jgi:hypothetical protein
LAKLTHTFSAGDAHLNTEIGLRERDLIRVDGGRPSVALYGPYVDLPPGNYIALIRFDPGTPCHWNGDYRRMFWLRREIVSTSNHFGTAHR